MNLEPVSRTRTVALQPNAVGAFRGLWLFTWQTALTWRRIPVTILSLVTLPILILITIERGSTSAYLRWAIDFYLFLVLPLHCLAAFGPMIRDELQNDTLGFFITRPLTRARLFALKYLCLLLWLEAIALVHGTLLVATGFYHQVAGMQTLALLFFGVQALAVAVYGALGGALWADSSALHGSGSDLRIPG